MNKLTQTPQASQKQEFGSVTSETGGYLGSGRHQHESAGKTRLHARGCQQGLLGLVSGLRSTPRPRKCQAPERGPKRKRGSQLKIPCALKACGNCRHVDCKNKPFKANIELLNQQKLRALRPQATVSRFCCAQRWEPASKGSNATDIAFLLEIHVWPHVGAHEHAR